MCSYFFQLAIHNIFISHAWDYSSHYNTIKDWLNNSNIHYRDYSIPINKALPPMKTILLKEEIREQIRHASVVVIIAGMYVSYSDWIEFEINEAINMNKPIIAIKPWGNERLPKIITDNIPTSNIVNWNSNSFITALRKIL